ncbi:helix-turn-helix domain-containing protein [Streptomyces radicis]|uniref:XRE family transcriptional regulator n=1 Tax=Streptomyces radicis TaxID=1750517 RepID=A0A3A9VZD3_9ACTN|nr:helix-turn-helix transcriptional regulator [Streptomyces radicis]RKN06308.1 XRE family transcriptional regulator [Streptomyces radicis]RKN18638.1 XRE family transcriptional regulator [Streptomyces radicis]
MTVEAEEFPDPASSLLAFFGSELRRVRQDAGLSQEEGARKAHTTQSMLSKVEAAKRVPSEDLARDLDAAFGTGGHFSRLYPLVIRYAYPSWFLPYVELEQEATSMRVFESQIIPGLLQTEDYARAMLSAVRPDNLDDLVAARMTRQEVFEKETPPRTWFVLDEFVLLRSIGGPDVFRTQLERLLTAGQDPRTVIQVVPRTVVAHAGLAGPFTLLGFDEGADVLYVDGFSQGRMALDTTEVAAGGHAYDLLRAAALSHDATAELIGRHLEERDR